MVKSPLKVKELIAKLSQLDPEARAVFRIEDEEFRVRGHGHRLPDVIEISKKDVDPFRGDDNIPDLNVGKGPHPVRMAVLELAADI